MTVDQMRAAIASVYYGTKWKLRVADMLDRQVIAIYYSFLEHGKFDKDKQTYKPIKPKKLKRNNDILEMQISIEDYLEELNG